MWAIQESPTPSFNPEETQSYVQEDEAIFLHQVEIPLHLEEDEAQEARRRTRRQSRRVQQRRAQQGQKREIARENKRHNHYFSQFTNSLKIQRLYISQFGFCADHTKPVWRNVQDYIENLPAHYLFVFKSQVKGCHNLLHPDTSSCSLGSSSSLIYRRLRTFSENQPTASNETFGAFPHSMANHHRMMEATFRSSTSRATGHPIPARTKESREP